jgi:hypothetical protein
VRRQKVLGEFINKLQSDELHNGYVPQDGTTAHTARMTLNYPREFYDGLLMSSHLDHFHLPGSSFVITLDYYILFSSLENTIFKQPIRTQKLRIRQKCVSFPSGYSRI